MALAEGQAAKAIIGGKLVFQAAWHAPAQGVLGEGQKCQVGEAAQLRRYLPAQGVLGEPQLCQVGEAAQLRRYLPAQGVDAEVQLY